jgi:hypothetical protein
VRTQDQIVAIIAQRVDTDARVSIYRLAAELGEDVEDIRSAYAELTRQRGHDPVRHRMERRLQRMRARAGLPPRR